MVILVRLGYPRKHGVKKCSHLVDTPNELLMPFRTICWTPRCKIVRAVLSHCCIDVFFMGSLFVVNVFLGCCTVVAADPGICGESHGGGGGAVAVGGRGRRVQNQSMPR